MPRDELFYHIEGLDTDHNGRFDIYKWDYNRDGEYDFYLYDRNENGILEQITSRYPAFLDSQSIDRDENGIFEDCYVGLDPTSPWVLDIDINNLTGIPVATSCLARQTIAGIDVFDSLSLVYNADVKALVFKEPPVLYNEEYDEEMGSDWYSDSHHYEREALPHEVEILEHVINKEVDSTQARAQSIQRAFKQYYDEYLNLPVIDKQKFSLD